MSETFGGVWQQFSANRAWTNRSNDARTVRSDHSRLALRLEHIRYANHVWVGQRWRYGNPLELSLTMLRDSFGDAVAIVSSHR